MSLESKSFSRMDRLAQKIGGNLRHEGRNASVLVVLRSGASWPCYLEWMRSRGNGTDEPEKFAERRVQLEIVDSSNFVDS
jgi:hypothetical protein